MPLTVNLRHLEKGIIHLQGDLPVEDLDLGEVDELIEIEGPVQYELQAERLGKTILVQGRLSVDLTCHCVRCLKGYKEELLLQDWAVHLPLEGEDRVRVENDCVDLTPLIREDILLAFPQHPLCDTECSGLPYQPEPLAPKGQEKTSKGSSAWAVLNKLKL